MKLLKYEGIAKSIPRKKTLKSFFIPQSNGNGYADNTIDTGIPENAGMSLNVFTSLKLILPFQFVGSTFFTNGQESEETHLATFPSNLKILRHFWAFDK